jgi:hypothetical protein
VAMNATATNRASYSVPMHGVSIKLLLLSVFTRHLKLMMEGKKWDLLSVWYRTQLQLNGHQNF